jgi:hypothetical protein
MEHIPTPWIKEVNGSSTRTPKEVAYYAGVNEDYVVRAVNSHEDLVDALRNLIENYELEGGNPEQARKALKKATK